MSDYAKRYNAVFGLVSTYADTPERVLELVKFYGKEPDWITGGYADYYHDWDGGTLVVRRTTGKVRMSYIRYLAARNEVQKMIARLKS